METFSVSDNLRAFPAIPAALFVVPPLAGMDWWPPPPQEVVGGWCKGSAGKEEGVERDLRLCCTCCIRVTITRKYSSYKHISSQIIHLFIPWREEEKDDYLVGGGSKYMVLKFVGKLGRFQERILSRSHHGHQECLSIIIGQRWLVCSLARERLN